VSFSWSAHHPFTAVAFVRGLLKLQPVLMSSVRGVQLDKQIIHRIQTKQINENTWANSGTYPFRPSNGVEWDC